ncbi:TPA: hypothetical protein UOK25_000914 [Stenotrophomonas maltophilia]|nr:hypothetical protein [Stenotrophomonas maltophilia]
MSNDKTTLADVQPGGRVRLGTPGARWAAIGEPDPHGTRYDCERAALVMGDLTDDELANAVFMHGNERQTMAELIGGATPAIAYLTAAKDRIRWLSRALAAAESLSAQPSPGGLRISDDDRVVLQRLQDALPTVGINGWAKGVEVLERLLRDSLAVRQPVGDQHQDDLAVDAFATAMKAKLAEARAKGRGGWEDPAQCSADDLSRMLRDHVEKGDPRDVANFCMMLHQRGEAIAARQPVGELHLPPDGFYKIVYDDAQVPDESFARTGALDAALRRFEQISARWNAHLFVRFANNTRDCTVPNATPAQAVDLGQFREAVAYAARSADFATHVEIGSKLRELLALIDSLAVGNGH